MQRFAVLSLVLASVSLGGCFTFDGETADEAKQDPAAAPPPAKETTGAPIDNGNGNGGGTDPSFNGGGTDPGANASSSGAAASSSGGGASSSSGGTTSSSSGGTTSSSGGATSSSSSGGSNPGNPPANTCTVTKDSAGFFTRTTPKGTYVAYVPKSYSPTTPMRLIVGLHGCGDTAYNFATWGVNPYDTRATQTHIGISVDGATGSGSCWNVGVDDPKVLAAIDDIKSCFYVHQQKITVAGYSSGGILAYRMGLTNANLFAGIIIENSGLPGNGATLLAGASRKLQITHRAHQNDTTFPIANVQADWTKIQNAGFPLTTSITAGTHDGTSADWAGYLIPASSPWTSP